jgi:hypothetical protein
MDDQRTDQERGGRVRTLATNTVRFWVFNGLFAIASLWLAYVKYQQANYKIIANLAITWVVLVGLYLLVWFRGRRANK